MKTIDIGNKQSCSCDECKSYCRNRPGWFKKGEVEILANNLGISVEQLFREKLAVDWWVGGGEDDGNIFLLAPALMGAPIGKEYPPNPRGVCIFFDEQKGLCTIHEKGKPFECREAIHNKEQKLDKQNSHKEAAFSWNNKDGQEQIKDLLGRNPESEDYNILTELSNFINSSRLDSIKKNDNDRTNNRCSGTDTNT